MVHVAADDNLQQNQFGPDAYKAARMAVMYERNLRKTGLQSVANTTDDQKGGQS